MPFRILKDVTSLLRVTLKEIRKPKLDLLGGPMKKETKHNAAEHQSLDDKQMGYYELAVYLAAREAQEEEFRWENLY